MATAILKSYRKDPQAVLDYSIDWGTLGWLVGSDTLTAVTWTVPAGLVKDSQTNSSTTATVWLSGGTAGTDYDVTCHVTTVGGRQDDRTLRIQVREL